MATTAYDRYLKNKKEEDSLEPVDIQVQDTKPLDIDQIKLKIQNELTEQTEPKKPVKWLSLPGQTKLQVVPFHHQVGASARFQVLNHLTSYEELFSH